MSDLNIPSLRRSLAEAPGQPISDSSLSPAGVMLLVYPIDGRYHVLLNRRTDTVEDHKGEIALPGGRVEERDGSVEEAALRETHEEMGILPKDVDVLGELDGVATISNYAVTPFVGTIPYPYTFDPSPSEVAEVIEVPVGVLSDPRSHRSQAWLVDGRREDGVAYAHDGNVIWGATAMILGSFLERVNGAVT